MRSGGVALAAALVILAVAAPLAVRSRAPDAGRETTYWLAVESLAIDGDLWLEETDRARFASRFGDRPVDAQVFEDEGRKGLDSPWSWTRLVAFARAMLGHAGVPLAQWGLFAWTAVVATATLGSRVGAGSGSLLTLVTLIGSAAFAVPFRLEPRALEMAAMATAAGAIWWRRLGPARQTDQVYRGALDAAPSLVRWLVAGAFVAPVLAASPAYLPLAVPLVAAAPQGRRGFAGTLFALGAGVVGGGLMVLGGPPWEPLAGSLSLPLYGWATLTLLLGRGVGVLPYFLPAILLLTLGGRGEGKRLVLPAVVVALGLQVVLAPFDFVDGALSPGNAWFLPLLVLLLVAAESAESARSTLAVGAIGLTLLASPWLAALGARATARSVALRVAVVETLLPSPSTLRNQAGAFDLARGAVRVRGSAPGIDRGGGDRLRLVGSRAELLVSSDRPLSSVRIELGKEAPASFEVRGGTPGNVTYRPSGEVALDVGVDERRARRHPVWWSPENAWTYRLELRLDAPPERPVSLDVPFGRPAVPGVETVR